MATKIFKNKKIKDNSKMKIFIKTKKSNINVRLFLYPKLEETQYVFPIILKNNLTEKQIHGRYKRCIRKFNKQLKHIALEVGINKNLTSYVARHSFATHLKFNGVSESKISQLMGHSSEAVTKAYLEDFGSDALDEAMSKLN